MAAIDPLQQEITLKLAQLIQAVSASAVAILAKHAEGRESLALALRDAGWTCTPPGEAKAARNRKAG